MSATYHDPLDSEDAPFLGSPNDSNNNNNNRDAESDPKGDGGEQLWAIQGKLRGRLMLTLFTMVLALEVGYVMTGGPITRIFESVVCREHFMQIDPSQIGADGQVPEELCKGKEVQSELAAVKGYMEFFDGFMSIFLAIPYGLMADRYGRKPTICLSIPGIILNCAMILSVLWFSDTIPLRAVWASSLAWLFGGGHVVTFAIIWTMMSDVTTEEERAPMFFKIGVAGMAADFVSNAASSWLMTLNPWLPLVIGWSLVVFGMLSAVTLPETMHALPSRPPPQPTDVELDPLSFDASGSKRMSSEKINEGHLDDTESTHGEETPFTGRAKKRSLFTMLRRTIRSYCAPYTFLFRSKQILLLLTAFLVYRLSRGSSWFLVQYVSTRYLWTLAQANFLISFKPALAIPLFVFVLPALSKYLRRSMKPNKKDLTLARASIIFLAVGTLGIGLSPNIAMLIPSLIIQTSGSGFLYLVRSLITTMVDREETARLFTIIEALQAVGNVIASLSITAVFQVGLELGGPWIGLAWMMTATAFSFVGVAVWVFKLAPSKAEESHEA